MSRFADAPGGRPPTVAAPTATAVTLLAASTLTVGGPSPRCSVERPARASG